MCSVRQRDVNVNDMQYVCSVEVNCCTSIYSSYLRAGQFGLCEDQGGGVDGVSQLLLHQLVGLGCLTDPGEEGGGSHRVERAVIISTKLKGHHYGDYSDNFSRPVDRIKSRVSVLHRSHL